jgi:hypothetical protein
MEMVRLFRAHRSKSGKIKNPAMPESYYSTNLRMMEEGKIKKVRFLCKCAQSSAEGVLPWTKQAKLHEKRTKISRFPLQNGENHPKGRKKIRPPLAFLAGK